LGAQKSHHDRWLFLYQSDVPEGGMLFESPCPLQDASQGAQKSHHDRWLFLYQSGVLKGGCYSSPLALLQNFSRRHRRVALMMAPSFCYNGASAGKAIQAICKYLQVLTFF
jgi:hypothetical protein